MKTKFKILPLEFYNQPTVEVAKQLLGKIIRVKTDGGFISAKIVETEAYLFDDPASHSFIGERQRTRLMFQAPGTVYIYLIYGIYYCFNVVTQPRGIGEAVLIRAVEPISGITQETNGPAKLFKALGMDRSMDGSNLITGSIRIGYREQVFDSEVAQTRGGTVILR